MPAPLAITPGEPAGVGPDLCIQLAQSSANNSEYLLANAVIIADPDLLTSRAAALNLPLTILPYAETGISVPAQPGELYCLPVALFDPATPGRLNTANAAYVLATLDRALQGCLSREFSALVTGPVQKSLINDAGIAFSGHTEYLAAHTQTEKVVMMLATEGLRVALATTHIPLAQVAQSITPALLKEVLTILNRELQVKFGIANPHILVAGLNPHAGENGHLGSEEIEIIVPVIQSLQKEGMQLTGPLPADTLFTPKYLNNADAVLAMYHDQGLPVLKYKGFGNAVNITLGLPFIRTSVDHGTALDLAGTGKADTGSLRTALDTAQQMTNQKIVPNE